VTAGRVFIVDDDEAVRDSLSLLLEAYGIGAENYASTAAFASAYSGGGGCLILDQHFPGTTGLDFLGSAAGINLDLPVILLTGRADPALRARAAALGVSAFLEKPVADEVLLAAIHDAMNGARYQPKQC
jgi:FixJ family two-component response regulator